MFAYLISFQAIADVFQDTKQNIESKATCADLVTETDKAVEKLIFDTLRTHFPNHRFVYQNVVEIQLIN